MKKIYPYPFKKGGNLYYPFQKGGSAYRPQRVLTDEEVEADLNRNMQYLDSLQRVSVPTPIPNVNPALLIPEAQPISVNLRPNIRSAYSGSSVVDYLSSAGQDSSLSARRALGKQFGINNVGTAQGNLALLAALRGKSPSKLSAAAKSSPVKAAKQVIQNNTVPVQNASGFGFGDLIDMSIRNNYLNAINGTRAVSTPIPTPPVQQQRYMYTGDPVGTSPSSTGISLGFLRRPTLKQSRSK